MGACSVSSKIIVAILGLVFLGAAIGMMYVGISVFVQYKHLNEIATSTYALLPASVITAVGFFMFVLGALACLAVFKESKCLLAIFFILLLVVLCAEVTAAIMGYIYRNDVNDIVTKGLGNGLQNYTKPEIGSQIDFLQETLHCCGNKNYTDWEDTPWGRTVNHTNQVPQSCCVKKPCKATIIPAGEIYQDGCFTHLGKEIQHYLGAIAGTGVGFAFVQILGMIATCVLLCGTKRGVPYENIQGSGASGLRV